MSSKQSFIGSKIELSDRRPPQALAFCLQLTILPNLCHAHIGNTDNNEYPDEWGVGWRSVKYTTPFEDRKRDQTAGRETAQGQWISPSFREFENFATLDLLSAGRAEMIVGAVHSLSLFLCSVTMSGTMTNYSLRSLSCFSN